MNLHSKTISSRKFLLFLTIDFIISFAALLLTTGGYSALLFIFGIGPFYFIVWALLFFATITSKRVRYIPILTYLIFLIQSILILFNIADGGFYGIGCMTKNFVQYFFDHSSCGSLWVSSEVYLMILVLYVVLLIFFVISLFQLKLTHPEDR